MTDTTKPAVCTCYAGTSAFCRACNPAPVTAPEPAMDERASATLLADHQALTIAHGTVLAERDAMAAELGELREAAVAAVQALTVEEAPAPWEEWDEYQADAALKLAAALHPPAFVNASPADALRPGDRHGQIPAPPPSTWLAERDERMRMEERWKCIAELNAWDLALGERPPAEVLYIDRNPRPLSDEERVSLRARAASIEVGKDVTDGT